MPNRLSSASDVAALMWTYCGTIVRPLRGRKAVHITTAGFQPAVMMQYSVSDALALSAKAESLASNARFLDEPHRPWALARARTDFVDETALPSPRLVESIFTIFFV